MIDRFESAYDVSAPQYRRDTSLRQGREQCAAEGRIFVFRPPPLPGGGRVGCGEATECVPPFRATTFEGTPFAVASYEGTSAIVLDFWASWCVPCATDMPRLKSVAASFGEDRVAVVGIHRGDTEAAEQGSALTTRLGIDYLLVQDPEGKLFALLSRGKPFMPLTLFIDHDGRVLDRRIGPKTEEEIRVSIAKIVN